MRIYECTNCHSVFIVNEADERVANGDYSPEKNPSCPLCCCDMCRVDRKDEMEND